MAADRISKETAELVALPSYTVPYLIVERAKAKIAYKDGDNT